MKYSKFTKAGRTHIFIILFLSLLVLPCVLACKSNNAFTVGDNIDICTGNCTYQNSSNHSQYLDCDDNVECKLTAFYENDTLIASYRTMTRTGNIYNYSLGTLHSIVSNATGTHKANILCYADKGWKASTFTFTISPAPTPQTGGGRGPREEEPEVAEVELTTTEKIDKIIRDTKSAINQVGGFVSPKYPWLGLIFILIVAIGIYIVSVRHKDAIIKKIEKTERKKSIKPQMFN